MMAALVHACPSFESEWHRFLDEWCDEDKPPLYVSLGDFAQHIIDMLTDGDTVRFPEIFDAIERLHVDGDHYVREAATIGILESLQNLNLHSTTKPEEFRPFLRSQSERWWDKLYSFWEKGELLTDD